MVKHFPAELKMKECPHCLTCFADMDGACPLDGAPLVDGFRGDPIIDSKYRVERRLGRGGMGVVYRVRHVGLQKDFALKLIDVPHGDDLSFAKRFRTEAMVLGRLKHPNIVEVTDYGVDPRGNGLPYLVMEFLEGITLQGLCRKEGPVPVQRALPILVGISLAIDYAHSQGVLHRDLKPANVFLMQSEDNIGTPKILDFGLARLVARSGGRSDSDQVAQIPLSNPHLGGKDVQPARLDAESAEDTTADDAAATIVDCDIPDKPTHEGSVVGTAVYVSPEVIKGSGGTPRSDLYAFGVLIYELLVGRVPFRGSMMQIFYGHLHGEVPLPSATNAALPQELDAEVLTPLAKDPEARPKSAVDVVSAIRAAWQRAEIRKWRARENPRRLKLAVALTALVLVSAIFLERVSLVRDLEGRTLDARFAFHPLRVPDPRLFLVLLDDPTLSADETPLADRADEFAEQFNRIFAARANWIAVDILLHPQWSLHEKFSKAVLKHADNLTLAEYSSDSGKLTGMECVQGLTALALGPARTLQLFGLVNLDEDPDHVTRRTRSYFRDVDGNQRDSWATKAAHTFIQAGTTTPNDKALPEYALVDYSVDWQKIPTLSWKDVAATVQRDPEFFRGRLVFVGESFDVSGDDYRIPARGNNPTKVAGVIQQAIITNTILSGMPVHEASVVLRRILACVVWAGLLTAVLCIRRLTGPLAIFFAVALVYVVVSVLIFRQRELILPLAVPLLATVFALALGLVLRLVLPRFPQKDGAF
jgi:serine/threonine protein kinase/CHASE2 domain-containing sensor protein